MQAKEGLHVQGEDKEVQGSTFVMISALSGPGLLR